MLMQTSQCANALCRAFQLKIDEVAHRPALVIALVNYQATIDKTRGGQSDGHATADDALIRVINLATLQC